MSQETTVKVLLNWEFTDELPPGRTPFSSKYEPGDILCETVSFSVRLGDRDMIPDLLEYVYDQLNIDSPTESWAKEYRDYRFRSLSVGDVVTVGESAWAVDKYGFVQTTVTREQIRT